MAVEVVPRTFATTTTTCKSSQDYSISYASKQVVVHLGTTVLVSFNGRLAGMELGRKEIGDFADCLPAVIRRDDSPMRTARFHEYEATSENKITESLRAVECLQAKQARDVGSDLVVHPNTIGAHVATVRGAPLSVLLLLYVLSYSRGLATPAAPLHLLDF
jgi:2-phospho-L-lactate transferase/gluconeogenesis factor (CofD/UPF0052 family)